MDPEQLSGSIFMSFWVRLPDNESMNKKLAIIPTILLSSALLLTGCNAGNSEPQPSSSSAPAEEEVTDAQPATYKYVAPPAEMEEKYKAYYFAPTTLDEGAWAYYKIIGSTTYKEDGAARATTVTEYDAARTNTENTQHFDKMYGEVTSDVEQTAMNVSGYLAENSDANLEEINGKKDLIVNRYGKVGKVAVEQDAKSSHYFVIFTPENGGEGYGVLVPQEGKTPNFKAE